MSIGNPVANAPRKIFSVSLRRKVLIMDELITRRGSIVKRY
jgi:hypothetical protein